MKKILIGFLINFFLCSLAFGAGSVTVTSEKVSKNMRIITFDWTADATNGTVPEADDTEAVTGYITQILTVPNSSSPPTDNYDIILRDIVGNKGDYIDVINGNLLDRDSNNPELFLSTIKPYIDNKILGFILAGNSVNSAKGKCIITIEISR